MSDEKKTKPEAPTDFKEKADALEKQLAATRVEVQQLQQANNLLRTTIVGQAKAFIG